MAKDELFNKAMAAASSPDDQYRKLIDWADKISRDIGQLDMAIRSMAQTHNRHGSRGSLERALDHITIVSAMTGAYANNVSLGEDAANKAANKRKTKIRKLLGYTTP